MKIDETNEITLVTVCDNNFIMLLAVLLKSIEENHFSSEHIVVYIVENGITKENRSKLENSLTGRSLSLTWLKLNDVLPKHKVPFDSTTYPLNIYVRLFIPHFLPLNLKRAIYLDVDMVVVTDISKLWNVDFGNKTIAVAPEPNGYIGENIKNFKELGLPAKNQYFNSGLIVFDLERWREKNATGVVLDSIKNNRDFITYPDQYGLNVSLADDWYALDRRWNTFSNFQESDPLIIHYIGYKPIYTDYVGEKRYLEIFNAYLAKTLWREFKVQSKYKRYIVKLFTRIKKIYFYRLNVNTN